MCFRSCCVTHVNYAWAPWDKLMTSHCSSGLSGREQNSWSRPRPLRKLSQKLWGHQDDFGKCGMRFRGTAVMSLYYCLTWLKKRISNFIALNLWIYYYCINKICLWVLCISCSGAYEYMRKVNTVWSVLLESVFTITTHGPNKFLSNY